MLCLTDIDEDALTLIAEALDVQPFLPPSWDNPLPSIPSSAWRMTCKTAHCTDISFCYLRAAQLRAGKRALRNPNTRAYVDGTRIPCNAVGVECVVVTEMKHGKNGKTKAEGAAAFWRKRVGADVYPTLYFHACVHLGHVDGIVDLAAAPTGDAALDAVLCTFRSTTQTGSVDFFVSLARFAKPTGYTHAPDVAATMAFARGGASDVFGRAYLNFLASDSYDPGGATGATGSVGGSIASSASPASSRSIDVRLNRLLIFATFLVRKRRTAMVERCMTTGTAMALRVAPNEFDFGRHHRAECATLLGAAAVAFDGSDAAAFARIDDVGAFLCVARDALRLRFDHPSGGAAALESMLVGAFLSSEPTNVTQWFAAQELIRRATGSATAPSLVAPSQIGRLFDGGSSVDFLSSFFDHYGWKRHATEALTCHAQGIVLRSRGARVAERRARAVAITDATMPAHLIPKELALLDAALMRKFLAARGWRTIQPLVTVDAKLVQLVPAPRLHELDAGGHLAPCARIHAFSAARIHSLGGALARLCDGDTLRFVDEFYGRSDAGDAGHARRAADAVDAIRREVGAQLWRAFVRTEPAAERDARSAFAWTALRGGSDGSSSILADTFPHLAARAATRGYDAFLVEAIRAGVQLDEGVKRAIVSSDDLTFSYIELVRHGHPPPAETYPFSLNGGPPSARDRALAEAGLFAFMSHETIRLHIPSLADIVANTPFPSLPIGGASGAA